MKQPQAFLQVASATCNVLPSNNTHMDGQAANSSNNNIENSNTKHKQPAAKCQPARNNKPKKGWLYRHTRNQWTPHWFVLNSGSLTYFRGPSAEITNFLDGVLDLSLIKEVDPVGPPPKTTHQRTCNSASLASYCQQQQQQSQQQPHSQPQPPSQLQAHLSPFSQPAQANHHHNNHHHYHYNASPPAAHAQQENQSPINTAAPQNHWHWQQANNCPQATQATAANQCNTNGNSNNFANNHNHNPGRMFTFSLKMWNGDCNLLAAESHQERQSWLSEIARERRGDRSQEVEDLASQENDDNNGRQFTIKSPHAAGAKSAVLSAINSPQLSALPHHQHAQHKETQTSQHQASSDNKLDIQSASLDKQQEQLAGGGGQKSASPETKGPDASEDVGNLHNIDIDDLLIGMDGRAESKKELSSTIHTILIKGAAPNATNQAANKQDQATSKKIESSSMLHHFDWTLHPFKRRLLCNDESSQGETKGVGAAVLAVGTHERADGRSSSSSSTESPSDGQSLNTDSQSSAEELEAEERAPISLSTANQQQGKKRVTFDLNTCSRVFQIMSDSSSTEEDDDDDDEDDEGEDDEYEAEEEEQQDEDEGQEVEDDDEVSEEAGAEEIDRGGAEVPRGDDALEDAIEQPLAVEGQLEAELRRPDEKLEALTSLPTAAPGLEPPEEVTSSLGPHSEGSRPGDELEMDLQMDTIESLPQPVEPEPHESGSPRTEPPAECVRVDLQKLNDVTDDNEPSDSAIISTSSGSTTSTANSHLVAELRREREITRASVSSLERRLAESHKNQLELQNACERWQDQVMSMSMKHKEKLERLESRLLELGRELELKRLELSESRQRLVHWENLFYELKSKLHCPAASNHANNRHSSADPNHYATSANPSIPASSSSSPSCRLALNQSHKSPSCSSLSSTSSSTSTSSSSTNSNQHSNNHKLPVGSTRSGSAAPSGGAYMHSQANNRQVALSLAKWLLANGFVASPSRTGNRDFCFNQQQGPILLRLAHQHQQQLSMKILSQNRQIQAKLSEIELKVDGMKLQEQTNKNHNQGAGQQAGQQNCLHSQLQGL